MRWSEHTNWIGGESRAGASAARFERKAADGTVIGAWPRSGPADVGAALVAARAAASEWAALPHSRRRAILLAAAQRVASRPDPEGLIAHSLGLGARELAPMALGLEGEWMRACAPALEVQRPSADPALVLFRPHWSELFLASGAALARLLVSGRVVIWLADPVLPALADRYARALAQAGLPDGVLAVLHDDGRTALRAALAAGEALELRASGSAELREELRLLCRLGVQTEGAPGASSRARAFGAGVFPLEDRPLHFDELGTRAVSIEEQDDPLEHARRVALAALGRIETLGGQLPGHVRLVRCHPSRLSALTEALLELLEDPEGPFQDLPCLLEPELSGALSRARELGLGEGATLIWEGREEADGSKKSASSPRMGAAPMGPLVFTNVESSMRIASWTRPAPLLLLMRHEREGDEPPSG